MINTKFITSIIVFFALIFSYLYFSAHKHAVREAMLITLIYVIISMAFKDIVDNFHFELSPDKACEGGAYMFSSNPEMAKYCSQFSPEERAGFQCAHGFVGAPQLRDVEARGEL